MSPPEHSAQLFEKLRRELSSADSPEARLQAGVAYLQEALLSNFVSIALYNQSDLPSPSVHVKGGSPRVSSLLEKYPVTLHEDEFWFGDERLIIPFYGSRLRVDQENSLYLQSLEKEGVQSFCTVALYRGGEPRGLIQCGFLGKSHYWRIEDKFLLQQTAQLLEESLFGNSEPKREKIQPEKKVERISTPLSHNTPQEFEELLSYGQLILLKTDPEFKIREIIGSSEKLFGYKREELIGNSDIWERIFDAQDVRRIGLRLKRMGNRLQQFGEEVRFYRFQESDHRWLLIKATPSYDEEGEFIGWEGFGVDITERRLVELQLRAQRQRTEALYEVSRALRVNVDPALVTLKGLNALIQATESDAGLCCFYNSADRKLEMVAAEGLSQGYLEGVTEVVEGGKSLVGYAVEEKKGLLLENVQQDPRAAQELARLEDLRATIVMPLMSGRRVLGAIVVFSREAKRYTREDFQLVSAAASQISFAARQAEFYSAEKREADTLGVLYRLTREISRLFTPSEIGEHLFSVFQQEFACKRLWFGVLNNQGTHIAGQAGYGPGVRTQIREVQIELGLRHDFLDEAIRTKRPVIVPVGTDMECSGLNRYFERLKIGSFVILPMVSLGQVVGVIVAEPVIGSGDYIKKKLSLLSRLVNEVAVVLMARRFEERVADSDKMRVAAVMASGIAHNFNNLLQAVMGQASLIQMQVEQDSPVQDLARTIIDSAGKGASLVKHLLSFSAPSSSMKDRFSIDSLLRDSSDLYSSLLGGSIALHLEVPDFSLDVLGDSNLIQQSITNLLMNAKEAIGEDSTGGAVSIRAAKVRLSSGEVDPALSPGTYVRIDIEDNGKGMDEERLMRCFEPFYSSKNQDMSTGLSLSGAGLGLSSAYSLIRQHGGVLTARSALGSGTTFSIFIPQYEAKAAEVKELMAMPSSTRKSALLILPQGSTGQHIKRMFDSFGVRSRVINDIERAGVIFESPQQLIQLMLLDVDYLGEEALSFIKEVSRSHPSIRIVIATVSRDEWEKDVGELKSCLVVEKPLSMRELQGEIREFFEEEIEGELGGKIEKIKTPDEESPQRETVVAEIGAPQQKGGS